MPSALILYEAQRQRQNAGIPQRANSMLPPQEQQRLLFEGGYPVLARVARQKVCLYPHVNEQAKWSRCRVAGYHAGCEVNPMSGHLLDAVPLSSLTGVGAAQSSKLAKIGLHTVQDLLLHLPLRY